MAATGVHLRPPSSLSLTTTAVGGARVRTLSTGCESIDGILGGGLRAGTVYELCGEGGSGKTHVALQCCFAVQRSEADGGLCGRALYICSEAYPAKLVGAMSRHYSRQQRADRQPSTDGILVEHLLHASADELMRTLSRADALLSRDGRGASDAADPVRLIVIDSIANLFRTSDVEELRGGKRWNELYRVARLLKEISFRHGVVVLAINQVTDVINDKDNDGTMALPRGNRSLAASGQFMSMGRMVVPSLGAAWTNFVNTRLVISLLSKSLIGGHDGMHAVTTSVRRRLSVAFSPHVPNDSVDFLVTHYGVDGISTVDDVCKAAVDT